MNGTVPWGLAFVPDQLADGLSAGVTYDVLSSRLQLTLTNGGEAACDLAAVKLRTEVTSATAGGWAWIHGRYMQMDALVYSFGAEPDTTYDGRYRSASDAGLVLTSRDVLVLSLPVRATPGLIIGSVRLDRFFLDIEVETEADESALRTVVLAYDLRGATLAPGEVIDLPPVFLSEGRDPMALIEQYASEVADEMGARVPAEMPTGWCSWYFYYNRVTEADVLANLEVMRDQGRAGELVQIDDGYQAATGDWLTANAKFPSGMGNVAARIRAAGLRPGLWLAPLVLHESSVALSERPEMALRDRGGAMIFVETWLGRCAVLDCTHPAAEEWLRHVTQTVVREWGYKYLKLDALAFAARPADEARYYARGTTAPGNLRRGLQIIREAAGDNAFILGCTCHFGPAIGLVDAMRVGPDVKETWDDGTNPSVRHALRMTLQRNWMHRRWWLNDPDCLIVRDTDTSLSEAEVRFLATGIAMSGGMVIASDDLAAVLPARRALAETLLPPAAVAAQPVEPGDGPVPSAWRATLGDGRALLGLLNWSDAPRWVSRDEYLEAGETAFDLWNARLPGMGDILLPPHDGLVFQVSAPGPTPRCVGDSASLVYHRLHQRVVSGQLEVRNDLDRARIVAIESRGQVFEVSLEPGERRWFQ